jgi:hypothetical protein
MGPTGSPKMAVWNNHALRNNPEDERLNKSHIMEVGVVADEIRKRDLQNTNTDL